MELNLKWAFFWPQNRTIVRSTKISARLLWQRAVFAALWKAAPQRAIERAMRALLTPPRQPFSDAELETLEHASLLPVRSASGRLIAWRWGRAKDPVVVLVHGWGGRGAQLRGFIAPLVERGFAVISYDAPGHGMSGNGESSLPHMLHGLTTVLDQLGPVHALVGHSVGGALAAMVMAQRPALKRAVLIAPPASLSASTQRIAALLHWPEALRASTQKRIEQRFGWAWDEFEAERASGEQPLLVIHDREDREVPFAEGLRHQLNWPHAELLETRRLGHRRLLEDPAVIRATAAFVAGERK